MIIYHTKNLDLEVISAGARSSHLYDHTSARDMVLCKIPYDCFSAAANESRSFLVGQVGPNRARRHRSAVAFTTPTLSSTQANRSQTPTFPHTLPISTSALHLPPRCCSENAILFLSPRLGFALFGMPSPRALLIVPFFHGPKVLLLEFV